MTKWTQADFEAMLEAFQQGVKVASQQVEEDPIKCVKLSPELTDGEHYSIVRADDAAAILAAVHEWIKNEYVGGRATLRIINMPSSALKKLEPI